MKHIDTIHHNSWYDPVVLSGDCNFVHVKDGCTGTIEDSNYIEIGENNTNLNIDNVNYMVIYNTNDTLTVRNSSYVIIGQNNRNIVVGGHQIGSGFEERTGSRSITINRNNLSLGITGSNNKIHKTTNSQFDGLFNNSDDSGCIVIDNGVGNRLNKSKIVKITETNNNTIATENLELNRRDAFIDYATVEKVRRVENIIPVINRQSDSLGTVLDLPSNRLLNGNTNDQKELETTTETYTIVGGQWTKIKK